MRSAFERLRVNPINWSVLAGFRDVLVRRAEDKWVIAAREEDGPSSEVPAEHDAWVGHIAFGYPHVVDRIHSRFEQGSLSGSDWWRPDLLLTGALDRLEAGMGGRIDAPAVLQELLSTPAHVDNGAEGVTWTRRTPRTRYLATVEKLLAHIQHGDVYEVNYCTERTAIIPDLDPFAAFGRLLGHTDAPFAALYRRGDLFALCMSPERFLRIDGDRVLTQPMKGTRGRAPDPAMDEAFIRELAADPKERSENIMAVDVARHDLSRIAASDTVHVDELCAVKTYPNVHQLVSTVSGRMREGSRTWDAVQAAFPMASMTGAPKLSALRLIDAAEDGPRGLFSGSLGYRLPDGTFDLNVVIRTITYDASSGRASLITGSAITAQSDPALEWEECELKARSVLKALGPVTAVHTP